MANRARSLEEAPEKGKADLVEGPLVHLIGFPMKEVAHPNAAACRGGHLAGALVQLAGLMGEGRRETG